MIYSLELRWRSVANWGNKRPMKSSKINALKTWKNAVMFNSYVKLHIHLKPMGLVFSKPHQLLRSHMPGWCGTLAEWGCQVGGVHGYDYPHHETWPGESSKKMVFLNGKIMDNSWIFHCYGWLPKGIYYIYIHTLRTKTRRNPTVYIIFFLMKMGWWGQTLW